MNTCYSSIVNNISNSTFTEISFTSQISRTSKRTSKLVLTNTVFLQSSSSRSQITNSSCKQKATCFIFLQRCCSVISQFQILEKNIANVLDELLLNDFNNLEMEMESFEAEVRKFMKTSYQKDQDGLIGLVNNMLSLIDFDLIELDPENDIDVSKSIVSETLQTKFRIMNFKSKQKHQKPEKKISLFDVNIS